MNRTRNLAIFLGVLMLVGASLFWWETTSAPAPRPSLKVASGSENRTLEPIIAAWADANEVDVEVSYLGSVELALELGKGTAIGFDAVWPAHSIWIDLGDVDRVTRHSASILTSPVVLGVKLSIAQDLGWVGRNDITIQMIQVAAQEGAFRLAMTSATQSNSGASAYLGMLHALAGSPEALTLNHLTNSDLRDAARAILSEVDRSAGSSGWLKDAYLDDQGIFDAMFNYEAIVLEANVALSAAGREPLYMIYPANGLAVADSPLAFVSRGDPVKEDLFLRLQAHLLSHDVQASLLTGGRRAGDPAMSGRAPAGAIWNHSWGAEGDRALSPMPVPAPEVIREALRLYQSELRKPSLTIWALDVSGSMQGARLADLKQAMYLLLDRETAARNLLQPSDRDITILLPFSGAVHAALIVQGAQQTDLAQAEGMVRALQAEGGTDIYQAISEAVDLVNSYHEAGTLGGYLTAIIVMTDGASDKGNRDQMFERLTAAPFGKDVPIHLVAFDVQDEAQLVELNQSTSGRLFKVDEGLAAALRKAKGYN